MNQVFGLRRQGQALETFSEFVERERNRLNQEAERLRLERSKINDALYGVEKEMTAIAAYESAKSGKAPAPKKSTARVVRSRDGSKREEVLALIGSHGGLSRADILTRMNAKGDDKAAARISNYLTVLTKAGTVIRGDDRKYVCSHGAPMPQASCPA